MIQALLTKDWNADPNAPDVKITVDDKIVTLEFYVNAYRFDNFQEGDKASVTFFDCYKYSFNTMNDEGYYMGQYRYKYTQLPWGEFYQLNTDWQTDFSDDAVILNDAVDKAEMNHYIFFFKDNTFECIARDYEVTFVKR